MSNIKSSIRNWTGVSFLSLFKTGLVPMTLTALMLQFKQGKVYSARCDGVVWATWTKTYGPRGLCWAAALGAGQPSNGGHDPSQPRNGRIVLLNKAVAQRGLSAYVAQ